MLQETSNPPKRPIWIERPTGVRFSTLSRRPILRPTPSNQLETEHNTTPQIKLNFIFSERFQNNPHTYTLTH